MLPVPWVLEADDDGGVAWTSLHDDAARAHHERLCQVCGLKLAVVILLGDDNGRTNGPGCHPRCMALAVRFCPNFPAGESAVVAYRYEGPGVGYHIPAAVFRLSDDAEQNPYETGVVPVSAAIVNPMTRAEVKALACRDPLGQTPTRPRTVAA